MPILVHFLLHFTPCWQATSPAMDLFLEQHPGKEISLQNVTVATCDFQYCHVHDPSRSTGSVNTNLLFEVRWCWNFHLTWICHDVSKKSEVCVLCKKSHFLLCRLVIISPHALLCCRSSRNAQSDPTDSVLTSWLKSEKVITDANTLNRCLDAAGSRKAAAADPSTVHAVPLCPAVSLHKCHDRITEAWSGWE